MFGKVVYGKLGESAEGPLAILQAKTPVFYVC